MDQFEALTYDEGRIICCVQSTRALYYVDDAFDNLLCKTYASELRYAHSLKKGDIFTIIQSNRMSKYYGFYMIRLLDVNGEIVEAVRGNIELDFMIIHE
jgi:hypothetical protein